MMTTCLTVSFLLGVDMAMHGALHLQWKLLEGLKEVRAGTAWEQGAD